MAQSGYTPIQLYYSPTATNVPLAANLAAGELAINTADEKLYFKNASGTVKLLASSATSGVAGSTTQVIYNNAGAYAGSANLTFNGTTLTAAALTSTGVATFSAGTVSAPAITTAGDTNTGIFFPAADTIAFTEGGVESMRIDSSGNVGIGTSSPNTKLQLANDTQLSWKNSSGTFTAGSAGTWLVNGSDNNFYIDNFQGATAFRGASYAERMRIDSSGNVGIGTSSPNLYGKFAVYGSGQVLMATADGTVQNNVSYLASGVAYTGTVSAHPLAFTTSNTERMRITSSGNVGIGLSNPGAILDVFGNADTTFTNTPFVVNIVSSNSYAAGVGAGIHLGGKYNTAGNVAGFATISGIKENSTDGNYAGAMTFMTRTNGSGGGNLERMRISSAGGLSVGTTADPGAGAIYATGNITAYYSDERLKNVSGKIENALSKVNYLSGVYYTNNEVANANGYTSTEIQVGVLAQQVKDVLPEIVKPAPFDLDSEGNSKSGENYMTVQYERLVPLLIEAIKELTAKVEALEAR